MHQGCSFRQLQQQRCACLQPFTIMHLADVSAQADIASYTARYKHLQYNLEAVLDAAMMLQQLSWACMLQLRHA